MKDIDTLKSRENEERTMKNHLKILMCLYGISILTFTTLSLIPNCALAQSKASPEVSFKALGSEPPAALYKTCRRMLVGPWVNQPEEYQGYNGFVGWPGVNRLKSGRWFVTFSSGYWHASPPLTDDVKKDPKCLAQIDAWQKIGMPDIFAPRGGRANLMHSDDQGRTWSKPQTLIDTELDDRHATILELNNGSLLCSFFDYSLPGVAQVKYLLSLDGGNSWSKPSTLPGDATSFGNGSVIKLSDGNIILAAENKLGAQGIAVYRSNDQAASFERTAIVRAQHDLFEPTVAELPDGRLILMARPEGDISFSNDRGQTWTKSVSTGIKLFDPHLLMMPNGVLACFHGSYQAGHLRVILSPDLGRTWHGPAERHGYSVDPSVYGYSHPMLLPDGSVYLVYIHTGGHRPADARSEALWALRLRINDNADGIQILPDPYPPAD